MKRVVGVRFKKAGKIYYFEAQEDVQKDDPVIVETVRGIEYGLVVTSPREINEEDIKKPLKQVIRKATPQDIETARVNKEKEEAAFKKCQDKIEEHKLPMKLVDVEYTFDNSKILFYFSADGRVDFRDLVKDLAGIFRTRIELRQIGVRDEAKMLGGLGPCGREVCCCAFLGQFEPVSIKMAKEQNLSLNPTKTSGVCGRLMCCLKYEQDYYVKVHNCMPQVGEEVMCPKGKGCVLSSNVLKETVRVKWQQQGKEDTYEVDSFVLNDVTKPNGDAYGPVEYNFFDNNSQEGIEINYDDMDYMPPVEDFSSDRDNDGERRNHKKQDRNNRNRKPKENNDADNRRPDANAGRASKPPENRQEVNRAAENEKDVNPVAAQPQAQEEQG